ncbi:hypothetical protein [Halomonas dongshanensis]|uniref:Uncharacterized protein n=1 Tax=Halomonas dongshanensis TaxID=2890835 RepID=A0ABT2EKP0_9GAMM|nr:hypothetical protein [Halomonas dongshanensis]MCS2611149.1 hypothetical protein [Halomonas dongshanensis]
MIRSLRKGQSSAEIWYEFGTDEIGIKEMEVELMDDHAVFRLNITPADSNQSDDAKNIFENHPKSISRIIIRDGQIRSKTSRFLKAYQDKILFIKLVIIHKTDFTFSVSLKPLDSDSLEFEVKV